MQAFFPGVPTRNQSFRCCVGNGAATPAGTGHGHGTDTGYVPDIQLADGSSGLDAVDDILSIAEVPVIFITAYPERLLTGDRPEPTYLVTKPFQEETVRAAISQALFFGSSRPLD